MSTPCCQISTPNRLVSERGVPTVLVSPKFFFLKHHVGTSAMLHIHGLLVEAMLAEQ